MRLRLHIALTLAVLVVSPLFVPPAVSQERILAIPLVKKIDSIKWTLLIPELGERSPRIATLRTDPGTKATAVLIRFSGRFHIPMHWHSSSESQMIVRGHVTVDLNGVRSELDRGDFNYVPAKMPHESWIGKDGALIYIHSDGPWDFDWVAKTPGIAEYFRLPPRKSEEGDE